MCDREWGENKNENLKFDLIYTSKFQTRSPGPDPARGKSNPTDGRFRSRWPADP